MNVFQDEPVCDDDVSSDEYISSDLRDDSVESRSLVSSDRTATRQRTDDAGADTSNVKKADAMDKNTFPVHVIIEHALHLPTVIGPHGERFVNLQNLRMAIQNCSKH